MKTVIPEGLLDLQQAAAHMGKTVNTVRNNYIRTERLPRAEKIGGKVYVRKDDCNRLMAEISAWKDARQGQKLLPDGRKLCSKCKFPKSVGSFLKQPKLASGYSSQCNDCLRERHQVWFKTRSKDTDFQEKRLAYKRRYRAENKEKIRAYKRDYDKRIRLEDKPVYAKRKAYHRAHQRTYRLCERIASPIRAARKSVRGKQFGFALVCKGTAYRANDFVWAALCAPVLLQPEEAMVLRCRPSAIQPGKFTFEAWHELSPSMLETWQPVAKRLQELEFGINAQFRKRLKRRKTRRSSRPARKAQATAAERTPH